MAKSSAAAAAVYTRDPNLTCDQVLKMVTSAFHKFRTGELADSREEVTDEKLEDISFRLLERIHELSQRYGSRQIREHPELISMSQELVHAFASGNDVTLDARSVFQSAVQYHRLGQDESGGFVVSPEKAVAFVRFLELSRESGAAAAPVDSARAAQRPAVNAASSKRAVENAGYVERVEPQEEVNVHMLSQSGTSTGNTEHEQQSGDHAKRRESVPPVFQGESSLSGDVFRDDSTEAF